MIIYLATNNINGKQYVGQTTISLKKRIKDHKFSKDGSYFHNSIQKYGFKNFSWQILKECDTLEMLNLMETFMIMIHHSYISDGGYNLTYGGNGTLGYRHTTKTIRKISKIHKGKILSDETKNKISLNRKGKNCGINNSSKRPDVRRKISKGLTGNVLTQEHRKNLSISHMGYKPSEETKKKMSESHKKKTEVVHCKKSSYDVYIGREGIYGNPFVIGIDGTREEVIKKYEIWVQKPEQKWLLEKLYKLDGKRLGCWCKPKKCHGDIIVKLIEKHKNEVRLKCLMI